MRINPRKIQKILGRIWIALKCIFETLSTQEAPRCISMNATLITFICLRKSNKDFSYTIFPVKKNKCYLIILFIHILKLKISGCDTRRAQRRHVTAAAKGMAET
jgi:hypothetical protein